MKRLLRALSRLLYVSAAALLGAAALGRLTPLGDPPAAPPRGDWDRFDARLADTTPDLDALYRAAQAKDPRPLDDMPPRRGMRILFDTVAERFTGGRAQYALWNGWAAALAGMAEGEGRRIHAPNALLRRARSADSEQVAYLMMRLARRNGVKCRLVTVGGRVVMEASYDRAWRMYDPDLEVLPEDAEGAALGVAELAADGALVRRAYAGRLAPDALERLVRDFAETDGHVYLDDPPAAWRREEIWVRLDFVLPILAAVLAAGLAGLVRLVPPEGFLRASGERLRRAGAKAAASARAVARRPLRAAGRTFIVAGALLLAASALGRWTTLANYDPRGPREDAPDRVDYDLVRRTPDLESLYREAEARAGGPLSERPPRDAMETLFRIATERLGHGDRATYNVFANWMLWLAGRAIHPSRGYIHAPDRLLALGHTALCDQQSYLLFRLARRAGLTARVVILDGHAVMEAFYDGAWRAYDPDMGVIPRGEDGAVLPVEALARDAALVRAVYADAVAPDRLGEVVAEYVSPKPHTSWDPDTPRIWKWEERSEPLKFALPALAIALGAGLVLAQRALDARRAR